MLGYVGCLFNSNVNQRQLTSKQLNMLEVIFPYTSYKPCMIWNRKFKDMACVKVCDVTNERSGFQAVPDKMAWSIAISLKTQEDSRTNMWFLENACPLSTALKNFTVINRH